MRSVVVLVSVPQQADDLVADLQVRAHPSRRWDLLILRPPAPLLGVGFWERWREARAWWTGTLGDHGAGAILLIDDRPGLEEEIRGLASEWIVWCRDDHQAARFGDLGPMVVAVPAPTVAAFAEGVADHFGPGGAASRERVLFRSQWGPFRAAPSANGEWAALPGPPSGDHLDQPWPPPPPFDDSQAVAAPVAQVGGHGDGRAWRRFYHPPPVTLPEDNGSNGGAGPRR